MVGLVAVLASDAGAFRLPMAGVLGQMDLAMIWSRPTGSSFFIAKDAS
jgi:hypothetical protein